MIEVKDKDNYNIEDILTMKITFYSTITIKLLTEVVGKHREDNKEKYNIKIKDVLEGNIDDLVDYVAIITEEKLVPTARY